MRRTPTPAGVALVMLVGGGLIGGCGDSGPTRAEVVGAVTTTVSDRYAAFADDVERLGTAVDEWCETGDAETALSTVDAARARWIELSPFWFGPGNDRRSMFVVDPLPNPDDVDALADGDDQPVDATSLRELTGGDQRGLGSLEVLLASPPTPRRCDYARGLVGLVSEEGDALTEAWLTYGDEVAADDESANVALRNIISQSLFAVRMAAEPDDELADARLAGVRWALVGGGGHDGITALLSDDTVIRLTGELDAANAAAAEITITTAVVGELGTTINFSDADGDG